MKIILFNVLWYMHQSALVTVSMETLHWVEQATKYYISFSWQKKKKCNCTSTIVTTDVCIHCINCLIAKNYLLCGLTTSLALQPYY